MELTEQSQGPAILIIFAPCFLLYKKQFSPDFVSQNFALTCCLFITYICSYSLNLVISELYVVDSFLFLIVKERLMVIISLTFFIDLYLYIYMYVHQAILFSLYAIWLWVHYQNIFGFLHLVIVPILILSYREDIRRGLGGVFGSSVLCHLSPSVRTRENNS